MTHLPPVTSKRKHDGRTGSARSRRWRWFASGLLLLAAAGALYLTLAPQNPNSGSAVTSEHDSKPSDGDRDPILNAAGKALPGKLPPPREQPPGHRRMLVLLKDIQQRIADENEYLGDAEARRLRRKLKLAKERNASKSQLCVLEYDLGLAELNLGREREAIALLKGVHNKIPTLPPRSLKGGAEVAVAFQLGVASMRYGETQNCCLRNNPDSCLLPIRGGGVHKDVEGSEKAIQYFTEVLMKTSPDGPYYYQSRWLINIAYMTLGRYPQDVPKQYLIPPSAFESDVAFPRFLNIAQKLGLDTFSQSGGAVADDFDNDGDLDIAVSRWERGGQIQFFRNNGDGTFTERAREAGLEGIYDGLNMVQADYNNDGHVDLLVLRGAWLAEGGRHPNSLLKNNGDGTFTDVTFAAGLGDAHYPTQTASWADFDNDGDLDLYLGNETSHTLAAPCQLFRNNGEGTFTDVAQEAGVTNDGFTKGVVWGDYDGDRWPDLYVSNLSEPNRLFHNNGDGTFTDVAQKLSVSRPLISFPVWFWDFDNDGLLDIYVSSYVDNCIAHVAAAYLNESALDRRPLARLYRADGRGGFEEVGKQCNLVRPTFPMGANFGDLDGDGFLDFYLGTGGTPYQTLMPSVMFLNRGGRRFADVTTAGGFGHLQKGHAVVFADLDQDGDQDVFAQMGGAYLGDKFNDSLYENPGFGNHWLTVQLVGRISNRSAIGARIRVVVKVDGVVRSIFKHVNSGGTFGANPLRQTIGLGKATGIERLEVYWPKTGRTQVFRGVPMDRHLRIVETDDQLTTLALTPFKLGPRKTTNAPQ